MPLEKLEAPYFRKQLERLQQGDLLRDVTFSEVAATTDENVDIKERLTPYCVVLSQDCDLEHDFTSWKGAGGDHDKILPSLLLCPAYVAELFRAGDHLKEESKIMQRINSDEWKKIKTNQVARYHFLERWPDLQVPELVVDFKHYFTIPRPMAYMDRCRKCYLVTLEILYREHLSARFAHYFSRIGLPELTSP